MSEPRVHCHEEVSRAGECQPCGKPPVAFRRDPEGGHPYPVCAYHARGDMVTLADPGPLLEALAEAGIIHPQLCSRSGAACFNGWSGDG